MDEMLLKFRRSGTGGGRPDVVQVYLSHLVAVHPNTTVKDLQNRTVQGLEGYELVLATPED